jgi:hypothetical protein
MKRLFAMSALTLSAAVGLSTAGMGMGADAATPLSFAVIGDIPYGSTQLSKLAGRISQINADPQVQLVSHLGDISSPINCSTSYYTTIKSDFDRVADPLVYTPGDNEWADCSRAAVGAANPLERLSVLRTTFFPTPGQTLGQHAISVTAQSGYPENVTFTSGGLTFAALHIVGSNNDLNTWTGYSSPTSAQLAEVNARTKAVVSVIGSAFSTAKASNSRAVVLFTQADMFLSASRGTTYRTAFKAIVRAIASASLAFNRPVFLFNGDTHSFVKNKPLTSSTWLSFYGITTAVPKLTRVTIEGGSSVDDWVKVNVVSDSSVLQIQRIPFT